MTYPRAQTMNQGMARPARAGDGLLTSVAAARMTVDANSVITAANLAGGLILRSAATAARTDTTDTAAAILASNPEMDIGDSFLVLISVQVAFAITLAGGTGVTASGNLVIAANGYKSVVFTKTGAATMTMIGL